MVKRTSRTKVPKRQSHVETLVAFHLGLLWLFLKTSRRHDYLPAYDVDGSRTEYSQFLVRTMRLLMLRKVVLQLILAGQIKSVAGMS